MKTLDKRDISLSAFIPHFDFPNGMDWAVVFGRKAPLEVEIGFGTGEFLVRCAKERPEHDFVGVELNSKRIFKTLRKIEENALSNVRLLFISAEMAFEYLFDPQSLHQVQCLFPCPWPKKGDVKHRLLSRDFLRLVNSRLVGDGTLTLVTDHEPYAEWVEGEVSGTGFVLVREDIGAEFDTKFERKWVSGGQDTFYRLVFNKANAVLTPGKERCDVKAYFLDVFCPEKFSIEDSFGDVNITVKDWIVDPVKHKCMVHVIVTEPHVSQHVWIAIALTQKKNWCVTVAHGANVFPTFGVAEAVKAVYEAAERTAA